MKFVTDLSKGVLGTPDSTVLWNQILANVPDEMLLKPDFKCLVVACGHCTEAILLVKRMQSLGISNERIQDAIWVLDKYPVFTNQAKKYGFKNIITADFLQWDSKGMKFDLVMGNPPYNSPKTLGGSLTRNLYVPFIIRSFELLKEGGIISMITPPGFLKTTVWNQSTPVFELFQKYNTMEIVMKGVSDYFKVGTPICYFFVEKIPSKGHTVLVSDDTVIQDLSKFSFVPRVVSKHTFSIIEKMVTPKENSVRFNILRDKNPSKSFVSFDRMNHVNNKRGSMNVTSFVSFNALNHVNNKRGSMNVNVCSEKGDLSYECENPELMKFVLNSTLFSWINYVLRYDTTIYHNFLNGFYHPKTLSVWTDQELYAHFGLTDEEINYIETQVQ